MSANIYWEPVKLESRSLSIDAPSSFIETMECAFGSGPWIIDESNDEFLRGLSIGGFSEAAKIAGLVKKYKKIKIWAKY